jgi:cysteine desulfurase family protein
MVDFRGEDPGGMLQGGGDSVIYLDNAATAFPKAPGVAEAVFDYLVHVGASAGRGGHLLGRKADAILWETRELLADLLGISDPRRVVFTLNVTQALNFALFGLLKEGDHVVTTSMEHNSVMRPLRHLERTRGIRISVARGDSEGKIQAEDVLSLTGPETRLVVMNHASNVTGGILPVEEVARGKGKWLLVVDAAQTAGAIPIDVEGWGIDVLAFTGHKALLGPPGVGGLCLGPGIELPPTIHGGTGTRSESHDHPLDLPLSLEAGTHNMAGIAGLRAALLFLKAHHVESLREKELSMMEAMMGELQDIPGLTLYGPKSICHKVPVFSINMASMHPSHLAAVMEDGFGLMVRAGLHCSPSAHKTIGTFPDGTVRISFGPLHREDQIHKTANALKEISRQFGSLRASGK